MDALMEKPHRFCFISRWATIVMLVFMLAACGFHLRGDFQFSFSTIYLNCSPGSPITRLFNRFNRGMQMVKVVDNPKEAEVILSISNERKKQRTLSYDNNGDAREYELFYRLTYSLRTQKGKELIEPTTITLRRTMTYDDSEDLAKEREKQMLYADMQRDIVQQIFRRLNKVVMEEEDRLPLAPEEASAKDDELQNTEIPGGTFQIESDSHP